MAGGVDCCERILGWLDDLVAGLPTSPAHRELLAVHIGEGRKLAAAGVLRAACELPLLTHCAITGYEAPAIPVAGACLSVYLGADLLDNIADEELPGSWRGRAAEAMLAATTTLAALVPAALSELDGALPAARRWGLVGLFGRALAAMSHGQHLDLDATGKIPSPQQCRAIAEAKSGTEIGLFAESGAALASDDGEIAGAYRRYGRALGAAAQISSDLADLLGERRDLCAGKVTLPVAHALATAADDRDAFAGLVAAARTDPGAAAEVAAAAASRGSTAYAALVIEVYAQRARRSLERARPAEPAARALERFIDDVSLLGSGRDAR